jgi:hypothetical protein
MDESEWLKAPFDGDVLGYLQFPRKTTPRKIRLFCCGLVRREIGWLRHPWGLRALELAERFADGRAAESEMSSAHRDALKRIKRGTLPETSEEERMVSAATKGATWAAHPDAWAAAQTFIMLPDYQAGEDQYLRDVVGNPFRPIAVNPIWLTPTVSNLARAAYEERIMPSGELDLARLAVLSDALEEAGCDDADILNHLRSPGPHVRGCWVVDLVLGKK